MNQLELILENIRLLHIEKLLQEAQSEAEAINGIHLINESIQKLFGILMEDTWGELSGGTWVDETKKPMHRASDRIGQVADSVSHDVPVEKIPGEAPIVRTSGVVLNRPKTGLGASKWK